MFILVEVGQEDNSCTGCKYDLRSRACSLGFLRTPKRVFKRSESQYEMPQNCKDSQLKVNCRTCALFNNQECSKYRASDLAQSLCIEDNFSEWLPATRGNCLSAFGEGK